MCHNKWVGKESKRPSNKKGYTTLTSVWSFQRELQLWLQLSLYYLVKLQPITDNPLRRLLTCVGEGKSFIVPYSYVLSNEIQLKR